MLGGYDVQNTVTYYSTGTATGTVMMIVTTVPVSHLISRIFESREAMTFYITVRYVYSSAFSSY